MVETIAPAVCGTRPRTSPPSPLFAAGALGAAARRRPARSAALRSPARSPRRGRARALAGALREAGLLRSPCRSGAGRCRSAGTTRCRCRCGRAGYGAGLGVGILTYQPVATFSRGRRSPPAASDRARPCWRSAFGAGRASAPRCRRRCVDRLAALYRPMRRVNAVALALLALALAAAAGGRRGAARQPARPVRGRRRRARLHPARADGQTAVVVRAGRRRVDPVPGASEPALRRATSPTATPAA